MSLSDDHTPVVLEENIRSIREALGVASPAEVKDNPSATNGENEEGSSAWGNHLDALGDKGQNLYDVLNIFGIPLDPSCLQLSI